MIPFFKGIPMAQLLDKWAFFFWLDLLHLSLWPSTKSLEWGTGSLAKALHGEMYASLSCQRTMQKWKRADCSSSDFSRFPSCSLSSFPVLLSSVYIGSDHFSRSAACTTRAWDANITFMHEYIIFTNGCPAYFSPVFSRRRMHLSPLSKLLALPPNQ